VKGERYHPSSISFCSKPYDFVPRLNLLKLILSIPEVILPSLSGKIFESRQRYLEEICWMGESGFVGRIGAKKNGGRTLEVRKSAISLQIICSITNHNPDKRKFRITVGQI
jgi:hypothetical protein